MNFREAMLSLVVALAAGLLLGVERQRDAVGREREELGGIRTLPLISLLGALGALARPAVGPWLLLGLLAGVVAFATVSHLRDSARGELGISSEIAALLAFALGALAGMHGLLPGPTRHLLVGAVATMALALLALKEPLHGFTARLSREDLYATTRFAVLALIVLPALPSGAYGPYGVLVPSDIGRMVALVASISFAGYVAGRFAGPERGLLGVGLLGGLVSSTAVTVSCSRRARKEPALAPLAAVAVVAACSIMFARVAVVLAVVDAALLPTLAPPVGAMAAAGFGAAAWAYRRSLAQPAAEAQPPGDGSVRNPFELRSAVTFGLLYGITLVVTRAAQARLGAGGLYASAVVAGLTDVDAVTLSVAGMHRHGLAAATAANAVTLAMITNTVVKASIALWAGGAAFGRRVAVPLGGVLLVGLAALALANALRG